ncbi:G-type lectin S-receptor-like serine/threonine-protein kinase At1g11330 isoform X2 [Cucumis sativus]|uniref:G-type lectin S-receptor-like serine/threonine-protein kinase At1g11330 isoform X2 n=1 Tax=Cucumis sativus TaxID=3659 RepID=UPI0012F4D353|nr:G-type lectin S-receptor-like serine/threonine-protein kinase At1g11330 isoform X2 [Cucumis sativus]
MNKTRHGISLLLLLSSTCFFSRICYGGDTITSTNFIKDPATIISNTSVFKLGFFTPSNSTHRYVGIWFEKISPQTVMWVANRDTPLNNTSGIFTISNDGNLVVLDSTNTILWSSNISSSSSSAANNTIAQILDTGNLVLKDTSSGVIKWESFEHPTDKFLPSMKLITDKRTNEHVGFTSWNSPSDPSTGNFSFLLDVRNIPEAVILNGGKTYWRSGPWNGQSFIGIPEMYSVYLSGYNLAIQDQIYTLSLATNIGAQEILYLFLSSQGNFEQRNWDDEKKQWNTSWVSHKTECDFYGTCGAFGICNAKTSPVCSCLTGFKPKQEKEWNQGNWRSGCVRKTTLKCEKQLNNNTDAKEDEFLKLGMVKVPFFAEWSFASLSIDDCRRECLRNCSCSSYAFENDICIHWMDDLIDTEQFESVGADLYLRIASADLPTKKKLNMTSSVKKKILKQSIVDDDMIEGEIKLEELPLYDFEKVAIATNYFDLNSKLGQGGFGPVYKGKLLNGQEIAVKRLSRASKQGYEEFINEVRVISKLQHRNLVRLLGCCIEGEEKMLIYEYMPNLSLDAWIFGSSKPKILDWRKRFNIVDGIARGLLYLHRDSRLKIIHRDLKVSNILLDKDLNPKISDFGMARIFGGDVVQANTVRVVGTYGYMSPEYAMQGQFSEKSDVFSFGVLLLEIISGRRNTELYLHESSISLLGFAWKLWTEDNLIPLIEPTIYEPCYQLEILRCIHVGLLCVQEFINDRPNVSTIISMLNSEIVDLPSPKEPGFVGRPHETDTESSQKKLDQCSTNNVTLSAVIAR